MWQVAAQPELGSSELPASPLSLFTLTLEVRGKIGDPWGNYGPSNTDRPLVQGHELRNQSQASSGVPS